MVHNFPEQNNVGINTYDGGDGRLESLSDRYKRCSLQNLIQHIDIYGKFKSSYVDRYRKDGTLSMITSSSYRNPKSSHQGLEEKMSKLSVTTKVSSLYPGHEAAAKKRLKQFKKVLLK